MSLFTPDLYRNFAIGFVLGAVAIVAQAAPDWQAEFSGQAQAAEARQLPAQLHTQLGDQMDSSSPSDAGRVMQEL